MNVCPTWSNLFSRAMLALFLMMSAMPASARQGEPPYSMTHPSKAAADVPTLVVGAIDAAERRADAEIARVMSAPTKRLPVADGIRVSITTEHDGRWDLLPDGSRLWRVRIRATGATDLRLGFSRLALSPRATLHLIAADGYFQGPYTAQDALNGDFNSPAMPGDTVMIELRLPADAENSGDTFEITRVGAGFRDPFQRSMQIDDTGPGTSGACNIDEVCPLGQPYPDEIRAAAYYEFTDEASDDTYLCTGTLMADVPHDRKNYFLTAAHCVSTGSEAASMVVYWNYQSTQCNVLSEPASGFFNDDQHGATLRATRADADFTLVELAQAPESAWNVYYAGWDSSGTVPAGTIGIHHPSGDVKKITAGPAPGTTDNCIGTGGSSSDTHWSTGPYTQGTTEGGSSGSGLFVVAGNSGGHDRSLIGILSGGYAACSTSDPTQPNDDTDCYGKLVSAWSGTDSSERLRDWLDPADTGTLIASGVDANAPTGRGHSHHQRVGRAISPER